MSDRKLKRPSFAEMFTPKLVTFLREGYGFGDFRADAIAGLTVAIVALPLSMAIAIACGLSPERGLYTAIVGGFLVSALGGSGFQIGGPAGAFIVLVFSIVERHGYEGLVLATMMAGAIMLVVGFMRWGTYIKYIPYPVTVGFTAGIAVIIFASQLKELLGLDIAKEPAELLPKLSVLWASLGAIHPLTAALSALAVAVILAVRRFRPAWPGMLIAVALCAALTGLLGLDVATIGSRFGGVPHSLPAPTLPVFDLAKMRELLPDALAIALLGAIESLLSAVVADGMTGRRHRSNCELVAQGTANIASVMFGGMPVTGAIARTATNVRAGARSPVSGMLHALYILLFMLIAAPLASYIPLASLGAVLVVVAWNMAEKEEFATLLRSSRGDALVLLATFLLTIFVTSRSASPSASRLARFCFSTAWPKPSRSAAATLSAARTGPTIIPPTAAFTMPMPRPMRSSWSIRSAVRSFSAPRRVSVRRSSGSAVILAPSCSTLPTHRWSNSTAAKALDAFAHKLRRSGTQVCVAGARPSVRRALLSVGLREPEVWYTATAAEVRERIGEATDGSD